MSNLLNISSSPHVRDKSSTRSIMWDVFLALIPAALFGVWNFGYQAAVLIAVCVATCVLTEYIWQKGMKLPLTVSDGSAALTGLLLALNLSSTFPVWMAILGSVFAIIIVKQLFGGLGQNFMNPALGARCFLMVSFAGKMTSFTYDGVTGATPLALIKSGDDSTELLDMFLGTIGGTIGETSTLALLLGAAYLLVRKVITWKIPVCYIATFAVFALLFGGHGFDMTYLAKEICGGGLILGAFFMATDYVTSPITSKGQIIFGILLGILTGVFRIFGASAEGVSYAIIISNLLVPLIEKVTIPVPFGKEGIKDGK
ncbi:Na+-transporting NADH:ubiquinone oxidoreductase subunit D [bacterium D16-51]|nr:Na+-transporting NADH:ubiquinone oxidoreductase subunit D [bacterium D16-59]RKI53424.1 Na+-transporting NADH:ubiquinone oxidoreductase subunit D [bacterium D16-51]